MEINIKTPGRGFPDIEKQLPHFARLFVPIQRCVQGNIFEYAPLDASWIRMKLQIKSSNSKVRLRQWPNR
jgi:hypothetical protein